MNEMLKVQAHHLERGAYLYILEVSRLARNNADWHRLLEICALADTLILDEDGVYDPANFNDRLLIAMTSDFRTVWRDPALPNRERKQLLAYVIEDVTLLKLPAEGVTRIHVRFKGGKTETLTTRNPKSSAQQVKTKPEVVELVDRLWTIISAPKSQIS